MPKGVKELVVQGNLELRPADKKEKSREVTVINKVAAFGDEYFFDE